MPTRRMVLRQGLGACLAAAVLPATGLAAEVPTPDYAMIIDLGRCNGCLSCVVTCQEANDAMPGGFPTKIEETEDASGAFAVLRFLPILCNQCREAPCLAVCPNGAVRREADGIVVTDPKRCTGAGACVTACPYGMRFIDSRTGKVDKCDFCRERLAKGHVPACVEACPTGARSFGDRNSPAGLFADQLAAGGLQPHRPELGLEGAVLYRPGKRKEAS
ncbi:4Fe-4S dicluster domain-containing protein [Solidesulfovibrio magneticus]|nr:4Fe-4S dicluster domain-containing protein [Solidesulfovibrio magneticus]